MAKFANLAGNDAALTYWTDADKMVICSAQPTTFAEANTTFKLAEVAPTFDAITAGTVSGRRRRVQAKTGVSVLTAGTGNHVALVKTADSTLRYVTTAPAQALASGGTVDVGQWDIEVQAPA